MGTIATNSTRVNSQGRAPLNVKAKSSVRLVNTLAPAYPNAPDNAAINRSRTRPRRWVSPSSAKSGSGRPQNRPVQPDQPRTLPSCRQLSSASSSCV